MNREFVDLQSNKSLIQDVLTRLKLVEPNERIRVVPLSGGVSSTILKVEGNAGTFCIKQALPSLKVSRTWKAPVERVYAEIAWLELAQTIVPGCCPRILGVDHLTNSFVMSYLPPEKFVNWKAELMSGRVNLSFAESVGKTVARIHSVTAHDQAIEKDFANDSNFLALRLDPYLLEVARQHPELAAPLRLRVQEIQSLKLALVHGDMSPKNILAGTDGPIILDAECACYSDPAFDAAFCLNHLLLKSVAVQGRSAEMLRAFDACAEAYLSEISWEPKKALEYRVASLIPMLLLARISGKSPVEYLSEPQKRAIFAMAVPLVHQPPQTLNELRTALEDRRIVA